MKLSTSKLPVNFAHSFSNKQVFYRISMLTKTRSVPMQKLRFLFVLPLTGLVMTLCSFAKNDKPTKKNEIFPVTVKSGIPIGKIKWTGSTLYTDQQLSKIADIKPGDFYDVKTFEDKVYGTIENALASLYMDKGYLFFRLDVVEKKKINKVDLEISVYEGNKVKVGKIIIKGNGDVPIQEVLNKIAIKTDELFNRSKLMKAQRAVAEMGKFNPKNVNINPFPDEKSRVGPADGFVDLEFTVERK
ncbi:MAG: POTRA domain-containing protein [Dyadobacter sp.]